jgi:hypothetical protein
MAAASMNKEILLSRLRRFEQLQHLTILDLEHPKFPLVESVFLVLFGLLESQHSGDDTPLSHLHKQRQDDRRDEKRRYLSKGECRQREEVYASLFCEAVWNKCQALGFNSQKRRTSLEGPTQRGLSNRKLSTQTDAPDLLTSQHRNKLFELMAFTARTVERRTATSSQSSPNKPAKATSALGKTARLPPKSDGPSPAHAPAAFSEPTPGGVNKHHEKTPKISGNPPELPVALVANSPVISNSPVPAPAPSAAPARRPRMVHSPPCSDSNAAPFTKNHGASSPVNNNPGKRTLDDARRQGFPAKQDMPANDTNFQPQRAWPGVDGSNAKAWAGSGADDSASRSDWLYAQQPSSPQGADKLDAAVGEPALPHARAADTQPEPTGTRKGREREKAEKVRESARGGPLFVKPFVAAPTQQSPRAAPPSSAAALDEPARCAHRAQLADANNNDPTDPTDPNDPNELSVEAEVRALRLEVTLGLRLGLMKIEFSVRVPFCSLERRNFCNKINLFAIKHAIIQ